MLIKSTCWYFEHTVHFKLKIGTYENIVDFIVSNNISFLSTMELDFTNIPFNLHGKGNSKTLLDYLSKNTENIALIKNFIEYFIKYIAKIKYYNGKLINFHISTNNTWENSQISIFDLIIPTTTTTTTVAQTTTTTTTLYVTTTMYATTTLEPTTTTTTTFLPIIRKGPYIIYNDVNTEMTIHWQNLQTSIDNFSWGTTLDYSDGSISNYEYGDDHQHRYTITGLTNNTIYYYKININGIEYVGSFNSAPNNIESSVNFIAYGDTRTQYEIHNQLAAQITSDENYNSIIISMGDLVELGFDDSIGGCWDTQFFNQELTNLKYMFANRPYMAALGNHDVGDPYKKYFQYPYISETKLDPYILNCYFTYTYGPIQFFVLDNITDYSEYDSGSTQYNWFASALSASTKTWKIVYFHRPGWSANGSQENDPIIQNYYEPLFENYNVRLVFVGHNHYYARALVNNYGTDVYHITTGGGGAPLREIDLNYPNIITGFTTYHYCKISVNDNAMNVNTIDINGNEIDNFTINQTIPTTTLMPTTTMSPTTTLMPEFFNLFDQMYLI